MAVNIRNAETDRLATTLAKLTGDTKTAAVMNASRARLARHDKGAYGQYATDEQRRQTGGRRPNVGRYSCVGPWCVVRAGQRCCENVTQATDDPRPWNRHGVSTIPGGDTEKRGRQPHRH
ncbi:MAG: type II toxin-antitoxin system VapB family antitoxin [Acidobacteria bacterium]|nr:type II toxin-antitoxin system VapB family antitoxin [Acidobacteriota bacterium]